MTEAAVREVIRERVFHRELGINVVDLGLVYNISFEDGSLSVDMTMTSQASPLAGELLSQAEAVLRESFPDLDVEVSLVWEPPWSPERMSEEAKRELAERS